MELIRSGTTYDFVGKRRFFLTLSTVVVAACILAVLIPGGLVIGVDFRGGSDIVVSVPSGKADQGQVTKALGNAGYADPSVQNYGVKGQGRDSFLIRLAEISSLKKEDVDVFAEKIKASDPQGPEKVEIRFDEQNRDKIEVKFSGVVAPQAVIEALTAAGLKEKDDYTLRGRAEDGLTATEGEPARAYQILPTGVANNVVASLTETLGLQQGEVELLNSTSVGPKAGEQLRNDGIKSIIFSMLLIMLFIALRFDFRYAPGAVVAIIHDVAVATGVFVIARIEFNLPAIAALLTVTGYSLNDTVVVYDRIRENLARQKDKPLETVINRSVNEMLGRTLLVSGTTLIAITSLLVLGGGQIRGFALALFVGVLVGTYSSIYIAAPILMWADAWFKARGFDQEPTKAEAPSSPRRAKS
jgi:preprotein translocase subunit SecF